MSVQLRTAVPADRNGVVAVFLACWRQSYAGILPQDTIDAMTDDRAHAMWSRILESHDGETVVAEHNAQIVGITRFQCDDETGIVHALYVDPDAQGMGLGRTLLSHATNTMTQTTQRELTLWVFAENAPSIRFYNSQGWLPDGETRVQEEFGAPELRLAFKEEAS